MSARRAARLFVSYSDRDRKFLDELNKYLQVERELDLWSDKQIDAGSDWRAKIRDALAQADAAILLVSQDFLASEFIRNHELPSLLESVKSRRLRLFLIPVGACTWRSAVLERFQWIQQSLAAADTQFFDKTREAWTAVLADGIRYMQSPSALDIS